MCGAANTIDPMLRQPYILPFLRIKKLLLFTSELQCKKAKISGSKQEKVTEYNLTEKKPKS